MSDKLLLRAARTIGDLRKIARAMCDSGHPGVAIRLQGFAAYVQSLGPELDVAIQQSDAVLRLEGLNEQLLVCEDCIMSH